MGACCTTAKQTPVQNQQLKKPVQRKPENDPRQTPGDKQPAKRNKSEPKPGTLTKETPAGQSSKAANDRHSDPQKPAKSISVSMSPNRDRHVDPSGKGYRSPSNLSAELDENVVNLDITLNQSKADTKNRLKEAHRMLDTSLQQKEVVYPKLDLTIPSLPARPIYQITNEFPVSRPYSSPQEWQKILSKHVYRQSQMINDKIPDSEDDLLMENILNLNNRNWIKDQIGLHIENMNAMQDSLDSLPRQKRSIQLREHFTWLVWAVAQFYFRTNHNINTDPVLPVFGKQDTITSQYNTDTQSEGRPSLTGSMVSNVTTNSNTGHNTTGINGINGINAAPFGGVSHKSNKPTIMSTGLQIKLPKTTSDQWTSGFTFKGVYFKLMPYEDALHVKEEIKALKYAQIELLDLQMIDNRNQDCSPSKSSHKAKSQLHREMILPLLAGVQCAGLFLYGTPIIYTQEIQEKTSLSAAKSDVNAKEDLFDFFLPRLGSCVPEFNIAQVKNQFEYLHDNIEDDNLNDPALEMMPILKHITKRNLIPIIDFEEFNNLQKGKLGSKQPAAPLISLNYLTVYLTHTLRTLSQEGTASALFKMPQLNTDEIQFTPFPPDRQLSYGILDHMLRCSPNTTNAYRPKGDISYSPKQISLQLSQPKISLANNGNTPLPQIELFDDYENPANLQIARRMLQKHGWRFLVVEKINQAQTAGGKQMENKRASNFYNQRENYGQISKLRKPAAKSPDKPVKVDEPNEGDQTPRKEDFNMLQKLLKIQTQSQNEDLKTGRENLESSPAVLSDHEIPIFLSPKKRTILKKDPSSNVEEGLNGNCVFAGTYLNGFKLRFSLSQHTYSSGIEPMLQLSLDSIARVLDHSDRIHNMHAYKELLHRKGINMRFSWVLLSKVKLQTSRDIVMASILCRTMRRVINEEAKIKFQTNKKNLIKLDHSSGQSNAQSSTGPTTGPEQRGTLDVYKDILILFVNAVVKNKFAKQKQVFDETLLGLFLSRLKVLSLLPNLELSKSETNYIESKDILDNIIELPSRNPILFLNSVQGYFGLQFKSEYLRIYRQDKYCVLNKSQPLQFNEIRRLTMNVVTYFTMREHAYLILARKISFNKTQNAQRQLIEKQKIAKAFNKPKFNEKSERDGNFTERNQETFRANQPKISSKTASKGLAAALGKDTQRAFQNMDSQQLNDSGLRGSYQNYQTIIDLSKVKRSGFKPKTSSEIYLPAVLYKLQTQVQNPNQNTVLQPFYEIPNIDVINEWVIVLESLFKDVYSACGSEQVLIEALVYQCLLTFFIDADQDSAFKILTKIRDLLMESLYCNPEIIVMCMMLTGLMYDVSEETDLFPVESEKNYLAAMVLAFQIYGDPRGRGNYSIPYYLFFSWKLSLLALAESRKLNDSELSEEMFDATLSSLYNHKKMYRRNQIEIVAAQELAAQQQREAMLQQNSFNMTQDLQSKRNTNFCLQFELSVDQQDYRNNHFNIKRYKKRQKRIVTTAGFTKPLIGNTQAPGRRALDTIKEADGSQRQDTDRSKKKTLIYDVENIADKINNKKAITAHPSHQSIASLKEAKAQKTKDLPTQHSARQGTMQDDLELSDVEIEMLDSVRKVKPEIEDETSAQLKAANFRVNEHLLGNIPFPHWTINRQMILSQQQVLANEKPLEAKRMQKEFVQDQITKNVDMDAMFSWLINYNPMMVSTGMQWDSRMIKEIVFCPNQNIVNSSDSSIAFSNNKLSQYSYRSDSTPSRKRKQHLGPYQQCLGKEVGGIQKGEIMGLLYTWGTDQYGQLGLDYFVQGKQVGSTQSMKVMHPRLLVPLKDELIKEICCGYSHTLAVNQYGQLYVWGHNESGQLGLGNLNIPTVVRRPILNTSVQNIKTVSASHEHSMALTKMQELYTWGAAMLTGLDEKENRHVPIVMDFFKTQKITQVACGGLHTIVLNHKGVLYSWGSAEGGQLGIPEQTAETVPTPQKVEFLANKSQKVVSVACGEAHTVVLTDEGKIWGWGMSMYGQLGLGFSSDSFEPGYGMIRSRVNEPTEISMPLDVRIQQIHCGAMFTLFLSDEDELYGCGINDLGQLGLDTYLEEMQVAAMERARQSAGVRKIVTSDVTVPSRVICFENMKVSSLTCGENHSLALVGEDKSLWAWGMFKNGQLGLGEVTLKMNPRPIQSLCNTNIHRLAAGSQHSLALLGDSTQLQNLSHSFYLNSDLLNNPWNIDIRKLCNEKGSDTVEEDDE